jgi:peptide/nickel transport system substrate-binding protein
VSLLPPPEVPRLQKVNGLHVVLVPSNRNVFVGTNASAPPLDNLKVRQAIDMAINREQICKDLLNGMGKPVGQSVAEGVSGFDPRIAPTAFDAAQAKQLLREAGLPNGFDVDMQYPATGLAFGDQVAQAVGAQLAEVGIRVKLDAEEYVTYLRDWQTKKIRGLSLFAFGPSIMDIDLPLNSMYTHGQKNYWTSPEMDALIEKQRGQVSETDRQQTISQISLMIKQNVSVSWLYTEVQAYGVRDRVGFTPRKDERFNMIEAHMNA